MMETMNVRRKGQQPARCVSMMAVIIVLLHPPCAANRISCSSPGFPALLEALNPVLSLSAIRPVRNSSTSTNVSTYFTLYGIQGVDEKAQLLVTNLWLNYEWYNEYVSWDPNQCGTEKISLPKTKFWVPDIVIDEFMEQNTAPSVPYMYLYSTGLVLNSLPVRVVSACNLDIYTFPFDIQNCTLTFNSYMHNKWDISLHLGSSAEQITIDSKLAMSTVGEWELLDITHHAEGLDNPANIDRLAFHIRVKRKSTMYVVNLLIPSCFLITVDLFSFLLPPQSVDRSAFKMTLILGYTVFLLIMNDLLPITGNSIPLINVFFSLCLALMVASLLETILITKLLYDSGNFPDVPRWVQVLVLRGLGSLVGLPPEAKEQQDTEERAGGEAAEVPPAEKMAAGPGSAALGELRKLGSDLRAIRQQAAQQGGGQGSEDWAQVGLIIDRLLFILYIVFITVSFLTIIVIWVDSYWK